MGCQFPVSYRPLAALLESQPRWKAPIFLDSASATFHLMIADGPPVELINDRLTQLSMVRRLLAMIVLILLATPATMPGVEAWRADGWLARDEIAGERLRMGDEFGCHGIPGEDLREGSGAVEECRDYLLDRTNASRWGANPLSYGVPDAELPDSVHENLSEAGFKVLGDSSSHQWQGPEWVERNGGSLEKNVANSALIEDAASEGGLVSLYWEARIEDLNVRKDGDVVDWLEQQSVWYTTWGEYFSYRNGDCITSTTVNEFDDGFELLIESTEDGEGWWCVPQTFRFSTITATVLSVDADSVPLPKAEPEDGDLAESWRVEEDSLLITYRAGTSIRITADANLDYDAAMHSKVENFNNHSWAIAIAGYHCDDLFEWSSPFQESSLKFTWLVEPQADVVASYLLPAIAIVLMIVAPVATWWTVKKERERQTGRVTQVDSELE